LPSLRHLLLAETSISDAGVDHFAAIPNLTIVDLTKTRITPAGRKRLGELRPKLGVIFP
jgi:hypothetical protein